MGFRISFIVFEILAFKLKNFPKIAIFGHFKKINISIANCEKTRRDIQKSMRSFVKHHLKCFVKFWPNNVKTQEDRSFCPGAFFETLRPATGALWHFSKIFLKIFLCFSKGFQNIYGYGGLKLQTSILSFRSLDK